MRNCEHLCPKNSFCEKEKPIRQMLTLFVAGLLMISLAGCSSIKQPVALEKARHTHTLDPRDKEKARHTREKARHTRLWMCPNPWHCDDYMQLFKQPEQWSSARKYVEVFAFYGHRLESFTNPEIDLMAIKLNQWNIDIALESGAIKQWDPSGDLTSQLTLEVIDRLYSNGGIVKYIAMDEPYYAGIHHIGTYDMQESLDKTIHYMNQIKTKYPNIIIGDIEPYPAISKDKLKEWINAFRQETGEEFPFFQIDVNRNEPDYDVQDVKQLKQFCEERSIKFGVIFDNPYVLSETNCEFYSETLDWANHIISNMGMPDQAIIQSWMPMPNRALPEDADCTFTRLIKDFAGIYLQ